MALGRAQLLVNYISSNDDECFSTGDAFAWKSLARRICIFDTTMSRCMDRMDVSRVQLYLAKCPFLRSSYMYQSEEYLSPSAVSFLSYFSESISIFKF